MPYLSLLKTPQNDEPSDRSSDPQDLKTYQLFDLTFRIIRDEFFELSADLAD